MSKKDRIDPPYFEVCEECGKHGRFVVPGPKQNCGYSEEIITQAEGMDWSQKAVKLGTISKEDFLILQRQIRLSTLPEGRPDQAARACNVYRSEHFDDLFIDTLEKIPPDKCHYGNTTSH